MANANNKAPARKEYYRVSARSGDYRFVDVYATSAAMACAVASQLYDDSFIETYDDWEFEDVRRVDKAYDPIEESDYAHEIDESDLQSWEATLRKHEGATKQQPRKPTEAELRQLAEWNRRNWPTTRNLRSLTHKMRALRSLMTTSPIVLATSAR